MNQKLTEEKNISIVIVGDFNTLLSIMKYEIMNNETTKQKVSKKIENSAQ